jgi:hypothetical protein
MNMYDKLDFIQIADIIFKSKNWEKASNEDKENSFFRLNRKFSYAFLKAANKFNNKYIDEASVMDIWNEFLSSKYTDIPSWYWKSNFKKKEKFKDITDNEVNMIKEYYDIKLSDIVFLYKHHNQELMDEIEKIKRFNVKK